MLLKLNNKECYLYIASNNLLRKYEQSNYLNSCIKHKMEQDFISMI